MALSVGVANPGRITSVGVAQPGKITSVSGAGGQGRVNLTPKSPSTSQVLSSGYNVVNQTNALLAAISRLQNSQPREVYAPKLNFNAINAQAGAQARAAVNPFYNRLLNEFLSGQAKLRAQAKTQSTTDIQNLKDTLQQTLEANTLTGQRQAEDTTANVSALADQAQQYQADTGQQFQNDRLQQARDLAAAGLTGGLGAQQQEATQQARNTAEQRQTQQTAQAQQQQELLKARKFEDLAISGNLATKSELKGEKQVQVDLANFIEKQGIELTAKRTDLARQRSADIVQKSQAIRSSLVQNFVNSIADPAARNAALKAYSGLL